MKILIAGLGSIGRRHLRNLLALGERDILLYRTHHSTLPDDDLQGFPVETDLQAALEQRPQAVIVANPTARHLEVAIPAAQHGCCLLLEKPVSDSLERVSQLTAAVEQGGGQVLMGFQFRYHPGLQQLAQLLASDAIGRLLTAHVHYGEYLPDWHPWEDYRQGYAARSDLGGGVVLTQCHSLDYLRWLVGEVKAVSAFTGRLGDLDIQVEDTAEIKLRFIDGTLGGIHLNYNQRPTSHRLELVGTQGTLRWDNQDGCVHLYPAQARSWQAFPVPKQYERNWMFMEEMRHFLEVARGERPPACSLADGIRTLEIALAAHRSSDLGCTVQLPAPSGSKLQ